MERKRIRNMIAKKMHVHNARAKAILGLVIAAMGISILAFSAGAPSVASLIMISIFTTMMMFSATSALLCHLRLIKCQRMLSYMTAKRLSTDVVLKAAAIPLPISADLEMAKKVPLPKPFLLFH